MVLAQKVLGVIRNPKRTETGIAPSTVAVMLPVGSIKKGKVKPKWGRPSFGDFELEQENGVMLNITGVTR